MSLIGDTCELAGWSAAGDPVAEDDIACGVRREVGVAAVWGLRQHDEADLVVVPIAHAPSRHVETDLPGGLLPRRGISGALRGVVGLLRIVERPFPQERVLIPGGLAL